MLCHTWRAGLSREAPLQISALRSEEASPMHQHVHTSYGGRGGGVSQLAVRIKGSWGEGAKSRPPVYPEVEASHYRQQS